MLLIGYTDQWRSQRKIMHSILNGQQAETKFIPFQELEAKHLLWDYLHTPDQFYTANQRFPDSVIMSVIFGRRAQLGDEQLTKMLNIVKEFAELLFSATKKQCNLFPWLARLPKPLQWWRPYGEDFLRRALAYVLRSIYHPLKNMPTLSYQYLSTRGRQPPRQDEQEHRQAMLRSRAHRRLIEERVPARRNRETNDLQHAPRSRERHLAHRHHTTNRRRSRVPRMYTHAPRASPASPTATASRTSRRFVKEALRWRPFIQMGVSAERIQDDAYEGCRFPAGTLFTWNAYALALNEEDYEDAARFVPERFSNGDSRNPLKGHWSFGTGT